MPEFPSTCIISPSVKFSWGYKRGCGYSYTWQGVTGKDNYNAVLKHIYRLSCYNHTARNYTWGNQQLELDQINNTSK